MTKLIAPAILLHALTLSGCGDATAVNCFTCRPTDESPIARDAVETGDTGASSASEGPAPKPDDSGQNAAISWLVDLGDDSLTGVSSVATNSKNDAFLTKARESTLKISAEGALAWSKAYGSLVAVAPDDRVIVAGEFAGALDVDGVALTSRGGLDVFVATLDTDGHLLDATALGGTGDEHASSLAVDGTGRVYVSGAGLGTVALDGRHLAWQLPFYGLLAADGEAPLLTGSLSGTLDFGGGPLVSEGGSDVFVVKLERDGTHRWSRRYGDAGAHQDGEVITVDFEGNVLIGGVFDGQLDFGAGVLVPSSCPSEVWCEQSGFVTKLDADGEVLWSRSLGPMRGLSGLGTTSTGAAVVSGALPGNVRPYRMPRLVRFESDGTKSWERSEWPESGLGAGRQVAVDGADGILWSVGARPDVNADDRAYLAKLL